MRSDVNFIRGACASLVLKLRSRPWQVLFLPVNPYQLKIIAHLFPVRIQSSFPIPPESHTQLFHRLKYSSADQYKYGEPQRHSPPCLELTHPSHLHIYRAPGFREFRFCIN